jgi:thymidylate kinase
LQYLDFPITKLLFKLSRVKGSTFKSLVTRLHEHQKLQYQIAHYDSKVVLWDAGHVQRLSNIARMRILSSIAVTEIIYERIPKASLLFFLDTPVKVAIKRMKDREPNRKVDGLQELLTQTRQAQQTIFTALNAKGIRTVMVDGTRSLAENVTMVCERINFELQN